MSGKVQHAGITRRYNRETFRATLTTVAQSAALNIPITDSKSMVYDVDAEVDPGADISSFFTRFLIQIEGDKATAAGGYAKDVKAQIKLAGATKWVDAPDEVMEIPGDATDKNTIKATAFPSGSVGGQIMCVKMPGPGGRVRLQVAATHDNTVMAIYVVMSDSTVHHDITR